MALVLTLVGSGSARAAEGADAHPVAVGAFISDSYAEPRLYDEWARATGHRPPILASYKAWTLPLIDAAQLEEIWSRGAVPLVTWEPWAEGGGGAFPLRDIAAGAYDAYIGEAAAAAAAWGRPLFVRFAHEMNGTWYPWGRGRDGSTPAAYRAAWRRVVRAFRDAGADNVIWVWSPNQNFSGRFPFRQYYPGDGWVDWVGLDGFNWARSPRWQTFTEIFGSSYNSLIELTEKPVMIAETGSWEKGGSKAAWVRAALERELPRFDHVRALLWWSVKDPRGDLRVDSSPAALRALREALDAPRYEVSRAELLATPERLPESSPVALAGDRVSLAQRVRRELRDNYFLLGAAALAACLLLLLIAALRGRRRRDRPPTAHDATP